MLNIGRLARASALLALLGAGQVGAAAPEAPRVSSPQEIITASCSGCHAKDGEDRWHRVSDQRKTAEGWQMTLVRMQIAHKAQLVDPAGGDSASV